MSDSQESQETLDRAAIANEVWGAADKSPVEPGAKVEDAAEPILEEKKEPESDPWAGIPAALREEVEGLRGRVSAFEKLDYRLKQTESRLGSVQNELHAAKEAAKAVGNAPSKEQIAEAAANQADWDELKKDFPEWTKATDSRLAAERAEILKQVPSVESLRAEFKTTSSSELEKLKTEMAGYHVAMKHPNWTEIRDSADFRQWNASQGNRDSENPLEVIAILDDYTKHKSTQKTPKQIEAERQARLESSQTTEGRRRLPPTKSEADMTASEMRAAIAKQVWS